MERYPALAESQEATNSPLLLSTLRLDQDPPERVQAGHAFAWVFSGWAHRPNVRLRGVTLALGDAVFIAQAPIIRIDADLPMACGFAGVVMLPPSLPSSGAPAGRVTLALSLEWDDGCCEVRSLGTLDILDAGVPAPPVNREGRLVAVCMATYNPAPALFRAQIDSLRAQTHENWVCLIQDDGSSPECWDEIIAATADDPRFRLARNPVNLGFYLNFERCLTRVPPEAAFVAFADQDDVWHLEKLAALIEPLEAGAMLAFSGMRVVTPDGSVLSNVFWPGRQGRYDHPLPLLTANVVTGCACMFRSELLERALPFPLAGRYAFHDHWMACCAAGTGTVAYLPRLLNDYVQHGGNTLGYRRAGGRLIAKAVMALALSPAVALAACLPAVRKRWRRIFSLLIDVAGAEYTMRAAFAETLRQRGLLSEDPGAKAYPTGSGAKRFLIRALLARGRQGSAYRATVLRLLAGLIAERTLRALTLTGKRP